MGSTSDVVSNSNASLDWRLQLPPGARERIVNKITDTLKRYILQSNTKKRHLLVSCSERFRELQKIAVRFEEKIYSTATSQADYLRRISSKMISMERKTQPGLQPAPFFRKDNIIEKLRKCKI